MSKNAQLISKNGVVINFQIPPKVSISGSASFSELTLHKGKTIQRWNGNKSVQVSLREAAWAGKSDLKTVLTQIKNSLGDNVWTYSQGTRTIGNLAITSFNISEEYWIGGNPVKATVSIELLEINNPVEISLKAVVTDTVSPKTIADATKKILTDKKISVKINAAGAVTYNGKEIGKVSKAGKITYTTQ